jgi:hypothetical protein
MLLLDSISTRASICDSTDKRHVHSHLVAVEISIECRTDQADEAEWPCLRSSVGSKAWIPKRCKRRRPVQHHRILLDDFIQGVPHLPVSPRSTIFLALLTVDTQPFCSNR